MQPAVIFHASDRIATWRHPLSALRERLSALREQTGVLQFGGAVGDLQVLGDNAETVARSIASELGLSWPGHSWHSARSPVIAQANWMSELTGSLGKIGQDVALMALRGSEDIRMSGGGSSSAMPHKQNPVTAERLVTLARFNATLIFRHVSGPDPRTGALRRCLDAGMDAAAADLRNRRSQPVRGEHARPVD
jgi:3-carboxy-cis,cis-muconate cycloisomerase